MKKLFLLSFFVLFSITLFAQTDTGIGVGWEQIRKKQHMKDSVRFEKAPTFAAGASITGVALKDTSLYESNIKLTLAALGSDIIAETVACNLTQATNASTDMADGTCVYQAIYIREADSITGVRVMMCEAGDVLGNNFNGAALYTYSAGVITQVAISANSEAFWEVANAESNIPFTKQAGNKRYYATPGLYYIGYLLNYDTQAAIPEIACITLTAAVATEYFAVTVASQTALGTPVTLSGCTGSTTGRWCALYK